MSLVERAFTPEHWRRWRKKLPAELREQMPGDPPEPIDSAREWARRILRKRRALIAAEETPAFRIRFADVAAVAGVDRGTVAEWAAEATDVIAERGAVVVPGDQVLAVAQQYGADVDDIPSAIAWLVRRLDERSAGPPLSWKSAPTGRPEATLTPYPSFQEGNDPTVDELAALVGDTMPHEPGHVKRARGIRVRALLIEYGLKLVPGVPVPRSWLRSRPGQRFMFRAWLANESGQGWLSSRLGRHWLKSDDGRRWLACPDGQKWVKKRKRSGKRAEW